jgi:hypothetical protein
MHPRLPLLPLYRGYGSGWSLTDRGCDPGISLYMLGSIARTLSLSAMSLFWSRGQYILHSSIAQVNLIVKENTVDLGLPNTKPRYTDPLTEDSSSSEQHRFMTSISLVMLSISILAGSSRLLPTLNPCGPEP